MRKKTIWIGILVIITLLITVKSATSSWVELEMEFEDNISDATGQRVPTLKSGAMAYSNANPPTWGGGGSTGKYGIFDGNDCVNSSWGKAEHSLNDNVTVCFWINNPVTGTESIFGIVETAPNSKLRIRDNSNKQWLWHQEDAVGQWFTGASNYPTGTWNHYCFVKNTIANCISSVIYYNGTVNTTYDGCISSTGATAMPYDAGIGCYFGSVVQETLSANLDEFIIFNATLTAAEVLSYYNTGTPPSAGAGAAVGQDKINLSNIQPQANSNFTTSIINFNATVASSGDYNCTILLNGTTNETRNYSAASTYIEFNITIPDGFWAYSFSCFNSSDKFGFEENTTNRSFFVDTEEPNLNVDSRLATNFTMIYGNISFFASINASDINMYGMNITIDDTYIVFNITNIGGTFYHYNMSLRGTKYSLTTGVHTLKVEAYDSHTAKLIPEYRYTKNLLTKSITYYFENGWIKVNPIKNGLFSDFNTRKLPDRYTFEFEKDLMGKILHGNDMEFEITSSDKIDIINSDYDGHLVVNGLKKWIDFESIEQGTVTTRRIDDYTVRVLVKGITADKVVFNSLGDLNVNTKYYSFYYGNFTETYVNQSVETGAVKFTLNFTKNDTYVNNIDARLNWNGTAYTATRTETSKNIYFEEIINTPLINTTRWNTTFFWNWNATNNATGNNITNQTNSSIQAFHKMVITNCSTGASTQSLNFTSQDELNNRQITSNTEAMVTVWNRTSSLSRKYSFDDGSSNDTLVCIYPSYAQLNTNYEFEFTATGYDKRDYIKNGEELSDTLQNITILMTTTGNTTAVTLTVVDEDDSELVGYSVEAWKYDLGTNNYSLIDTKTTNSDGECVFNLYVTGTEYMFRIYNTVGTLVHTEPKMELTGTEYTIRIILGTTPQSTIIKLRNLDYTLAIDSTTRNFTLEWDDSTTELIDSIKLKVIQTNATNDIVLYEQSSTDDASTLYYNVSSGASGIFIGYASAIASSDGGEYPLDSVSYDYREEWDVFGVEALIMAFMFIGTMMFVGIAISAEATIILTMLGMITFYWLGFIHVALTGAVPIIVAAIVIVVRISRR